MLKIPLLIQGSTTTPSRLPPAWIFVGLAVGIVLSVTLFLTIRALEHREVDKRAENIVHEQIEKLQVTLLPLIDRDQFCQFIPSTHARRTKLYLNFLLIQSTRL